MSFELCYNVMFLRVKGHRLLFQSLQLSRPVVPLDKGTDGDDSLPEILTDLPPLNTLIKVKK